MTIVRFKRISFWRFIAECFFPELRERRLERVERLELALMTIDDDVRFEITPPWRRGRS